MSNIGAGRRWQTLNRGLTTSLRFTAGRSPAGLQAKLSKQQYFLLQLCRARAGGSRRSVLPVRQAYLSTSDNQDGWLQQYEELQLTVRVPRLHRHPGLPVLPSKFCLPSLPA